VVLGDQKRIHGLHVLLELLHVPLELRPSVLEPRDHLGIAETQLGGDLVPVGRAQVLLVQESLLQLEYLLIRERGPALALLLRLLPIVEQVQVIGLLCNGKRSDTISRLRLFVGNQEYQEHRNEREEEEEEEIFRSSRGFPRLLSIDADRDLPSATLAVPFPAFEIPKFRSGFRGSVVTWRASNQRAETRARVARKRTIYSAAVKSCR